MATNCENCTKIEKCEIKNDERKLPETIPYVAHEAMLDRCDRHIKKWIIAFFVVLGMLFATNTGWIIYESQFTTVSYDQDGEGLNNVNVGEQGDINYGAEGQDTTQEEQ